MISNETLKTIRNRRSIRSFKSEQIKEEELQAILEAGLYAPSAKNQQAWHFTVIQCKEMLTTLNQETKAMSSQIENEYIRQALSNEKMNIFYGAPTVIIVSGAEEAIVIEADCAAANQNMLLAAEALGLGSCWINFLTFLFNGPKGEQYKKELGIPEGYKPFYSAALGYKKVDVLNAPPRKPNLVNYIK
jgi:nitroreductase